MKRYSKLVDLPPQVRNVLSDARQKQWRAAFWLAEKTDAATAYQQAWRAVLGDVFADEVPATALPAVALQDFTPPQNPLIFSEHVGTLEFFDVDGAKHSWIQAMRPGKFHHPMHGEIALTPERIARFAANVNENVRGHQLDIDYNHKDGVEGDKAAGWVAQAEARDDGLWVDVAWTEDGAAAVQKGLYRYFSPEFVNEWKHPEGAVYEDVLFGGALTNRPFLKDMLPVNLSEQIAERDARKTPVKPEQTHDEEVERMMEFLVKLAEMLGVKLDDGDDAEEKNSEAVATKVKELTEGHSTLSTEIVELREFKSKHAKPEDDKARKFAEMFPEEALQLAETRRKLQEKEVSERLSEWTHSSANKGIPPVVADKVKAYRTALEGDAALKFDEIMSEIVKTGTVDLSERGGSGDRGPSGDPETDFLEAVMKLREADAKLSFSEAKDKVRIAQPDLFEAWQSKTQPRAS